MRLARELTGKSYPEIGRAFSRDHSCGDSRHGEGPRGWRSAHFGEESRMPSPSPEPRTDELFVVHVQDTAAEALAGHAGAEYLSPAQERQQALQLVEPNRSAETL